MVQLAIRLSPRQPGYTITVWLFARVRMLMSAATICCDFEIDDIVMSGAPDQQDGREVGSDLVV